MRVGGQRHAPAPLPPGIPGTHYIGGWVGSKAGLDGCGKSHPPPGFDPRTVQLVASRYTDYGIPAQFYSSLVIRSVGIINVMAIIFFYFLCNFCPLF